MAEPPDAPAPKPPDRAALHEAALAHLGRFAATEAALLGVLRRRVRRWEKRAREANVDPDAIAAASAVGLAAAGEIVSRLVAAGAVDDAAFAAARSRRLHREGRSRRAIAAHLAARGIAVDAAQAALPEGGEGELDAALAFARRRRIGPFRATEEADAARKLRELGAFARAGFPRDVALRALAMDEGDAEEAVLRLKQS
jgi:regulatory protein